MDGRITETNETPKVELDVKDKKILQALHDDSRESLSKLADKVRLKRDTVDYRIKRLQNNDVIRNFISVIDYRKLGYMSFHVFLLLDEKDKKKQEALLNELKEHPSVIFVIEYSDRWDLEVMLISKDIDEFYDIMTELTHKFPEIVLEKDKLVVIDEFCSYYLPHHFRTDKASITFKKEKEVVPLDETDIKILEEVAMNAREPSFQIAQRVGTSTDTVIKRIKKMRASGVIKQFSTLVNLTALDYYWYTYALRMQRFDNADAAKLRAFAEHHPFIIRAVKTLGDWDFLLYIAADNRKNFHDVIKEIKRLFAHNLKKYDTWVGYKEYYFNPFPAVLKK